uniref:Uncharacterized protein n=1 Tax=Thermosporothrix sp. COM3 TaxID=2490863 RepID=A0A455SVE3_9CHLR|nr:hypothetical protein KTC_63570 [Thermosporothrix sp. COM3]
MDTFWHLLARTWSAAAFFHPLIQERGREWEKILTALLPEAEKVAVEPILSAGQREVLTRLLDTLQDPSTGLVSTIEENLSPKRRTEVVYETLPGNVAYVRVKHWFDFAISPGSFAQWDEAVQLVTGAVEAAVHEQASALVLDFRETTGTRAERHSEDRFIYGRLRTELISRLFERPISLPQLARV